MSDQSEHHQDPDPVEALVTHIHIVIPCVGAVLIFLLAFIAITLA